MDDLLTTARSSEKAVQLLREVYALLASGGFLMAKWTSNRLEVLETIRASFLAPQLHEIDLHEEDLPSQKALGLVWDTNADQLRIKVVIPGHPWTRRGLLSVLASVYDPLGVVGPFMLLAKLLLQRLGWDSIIPNEERLLWERWLDALPRLNGLSILHC